MNIGTITEANCKQFVYDYGEVNYTAEFAQASKSFPYDNGSLPADLKLKNVLEWYFYEWVNPKSGKTIVREFVEKFSVPEPLRRKMLQMERPFSSEFRVISVNENQNSMVVEDKKTRKKHDIVRVQALDDYRVGRQLKGRIHGWGNAWRFAGITGIRLSEEEAEKEMFAKHGIVSPHMLMRHFEDGKMAEIDCVIIGAKTTVYGILDKYPAHWIDGICGNLGIEREGVLKREKIRLILERINQDSILTGLPDEEKKCLETVANAGGMVKYSKLREFSDEMPYFWTEHGVNSTIGKLRAKGLVYVGRTMVRGRFCKMALMPRELVPKIRNM